MYTNPACKIPLLMKFQCELILMKDCKEKLYCIYLTTNEQLASYILPECFFEPTTIHRTQFFVQKDRTAEYYFQTIKQMSLWCNSHRICLSVSNKWISPQCMSQRSYPFFSNKQVFSVTVTELDFVFYSKTVKGFSNIKN